MIRTPIVFEGECYGLITDSIVPGVDPGRYYVSNYSCAVFDTYRQRYLSTHYVGCGYLSVVLHTIYGKKSYLLHRLVGMVFIPGDFSLQINHINGIKINCRVDNLEWVTPLENLRHAINTGLQKIGEDKPNAILTNEQAKIICECLVNRERISRILQLIGLEDTIKNRRLIVDIKRRKTFTFISKDYDFDNDQLCERELSNDIVSRICSMIQSKPNITNSEIYSAIGFPENCDSKDRRRIMEKIGSIRRRSAYTDISKNYTW